VSTIKLTKNGLRDQQKRLNQLERYLPTLKLKKMMLQLVVNEVRAEISALQIEYDRAKSKMEKEAALLTEKLPVEPKEFAAVKRVEKRFENIAGSDVPFFIGIEFVDHPYSLLDTPPWFDTFVTSLRRLTSLQVQMDTARTRKRILEEELRQVSIRVNLFEKVLIPRHLQNIKKIRIFLGDQQLAAVGQAKVAKFKIEEKKQEVLHGYL